MSRVDPTSTLGGLVAERPGRATVFDRLRLDYCCGGSETLAEACRAHGLDLGMVQAELETSDAAVVRDPGFETRDWRAASIGEQHPDAARVRIGPKERGRAPFDLGDRVASSLLSGVDR